MSDCQSNPHIQQGRIDNEYQVLAVSGEGGTACVYKVRNATDPHLYALKMLKPALVKDPQVVRLFRREAQHLLELNHPNIVRFYNFKIEPLHTETPVFVYILMDYIEGFSLQELLHTRQLSLDEAMLVLVQAARALHYVHEHKLIHRDVKAGNFMVEAKTGKLFLTDFGITGGVHGLENLVVGTRGYMAPEQHQGGAVTQQTDLYAFAVLAYEVLTGRRPFVPRNLKSYEEAAADLADQHINSKVPSLRKLRPELPAGIDNLFETALAKNPAERFQSVQAFAQALHKVLRPQLSAPLQNYTEITVVPIPLEKTQPDKRRKRLGWALVLGLFLAIAVLLIFILFLPDKEILLTEEITPEASASLTPATTQIVTEVAHITPTPAITVSPVPIASATFTTLPVIIESGVVPTQQLPSATATSTASLTYTATSTPTATLTLTPSPTATLVPAPTLYLSDKVYLPVSQDGLLLVGREIALVDALQFLGEQTRGLLLLNTGQVQGFRLELELTDSLQNVHAYGFVFRVQDTDNYLRFSLIPARGSWTMEEIVDGQAQLLDNGQLQASSSYQHLTVMGWGDYFRIEIGDEVLQQQVSYYQEGYLGVYFDLQNAAILPIKRLTFGLVDTEAYAAATASPTPAQYITIEYYLQQEVSALLAAGSIEAFTLDCQEFSAHYTALDKYIALGGKPGELAQEVKRTGEFLTSQCQMNVTISTPISVQGFGTDFLEWRELTQELLTQITILIEQ